MKTKIIPFDLETAKKIQAGEIEGKIKTGPKEADVTIISFNRKGPFNIVGLIDGFRIVTYNTEGYSEDCVEEVIPHRLCIEVPDNDPQFKPFDKVLVRDEHKGYVCWYPKFFCRYIDDEQRPYVTMEGFSYEQCIPYDGNEHLVGTTDKPKEE